MDHWPRSHTAKVAKHNRITKMLTLQINCTTISAEARHNMVETMIKECDGTITDSSEGHVIFSGGSVTQISKAAMIAFAWIDEVSR